MRALIVALALFVAACASPLVTAQRSVSAAATLGAAAGELVISVNAERDQAIAGQVLLDHDVAKAEKARAEWHAQRDKAMQALRTYNAIVVAAGATAMLAGSKQISLGAILISLSDAYTALKSAMDAYGVKLPGGI